MRSTGDRIRHTICFELFGLALATPLGTLVFDHSPTDIGAIAVGSSLIATGWNFVYNLGFDKLMMRLRGTTRKTVPLRILHAFLFEGGLLLVLLPLISAYLGITLWEALMMDLAFAGFYLVYAFVFNWAYDLVFPIPDEAVQGTR